MKQIPHALGNLCHRGHDHGGGSLRYLVNGQPIGSCVDCGREANNKHRAGLREERKKLAEAQGRDDGKYLGTVCRRNHDAGGTSLRYVRDGSCVQCDRERRKRRRESTSGSNYERTRKHRQNKARAVNEFAEPDLRAERAKTFEAESQRRKLNKEIKKHGR